MPTQPDCNMPTQPDCNMPAQPGKGVPSSRAPLRTFTSRATGLDRQLAPIHLLSVIPLSAR